MCGQFYRLVVKIAKLKIVFLDCISPCRKIKGFKSFTTLIDVELPDFVANSDSNSAITGLVVTITSFN